MSEEQGRNTAEVPWEFAGWGTAEKLESLPKLPEQSTLHPGHKLGQWSATAICGNDITSSCLYVSALAGAAAGPLAPIILAAVAGVLFLFRKIYAEVGSALPLNGGTYTLLLNTTSQQFAAAAAVLTLLSYIATAVISAGEAMHYAHELLPGLDVFWATIGLLGVFAFLNLVGISESAVAAIAIFAIHMLTLTILSVASAIQVLGDPSTFIANWHMPPPGGLLHALFVGFAASMLGISGFESSANFIEEQKPGVFPKTLRNMWIAVALFNPLISLLSMGLVPLDEFAEHQTSLLAAMGDRSAGPWLATLVSVDAVLVLSGAVLTAYVGVTGLVRRMSLDRCLPQVLLKQNKLRGTNHWIILLFFFLSASIVAMTSEDHEVKVDVLAGVYTISFLSVMALYAIGNILLKVRRGRMKRSVRATYPAVVVALIAVLVGLAGNLTAENLKVFGPYFLGVGGAVAVMFMRIPLLRVVLFVSQSVFDKVLAFNEWVKDKVTRKAKEISDLSVLYFTRGDDLATLNRAALYVLRNEQTRRMKVVHVYKDEADIPVELSEHLQTIDRLYPRLRVDFLAVKGEFEPALIDALSEYLGVPKNYMFIGTPGDHFPHQIEELGGVRLII